jgi:hypothetical protein
LQACIDTGDEPIPLTWWEFRTQLSVEIDTLQTRVELLTSDL